MKKIIFISILSGLIQITLQAQITRTYLCILRSNAQQDTLYDGTILPIFGITNSLGQFATIPAKNLYARYQDSVVLDTRSISQGDHHTIHLHGLDVDTRNDGDPATSFALEHMQDTTYSFNADYPGLYIYHCHMADVIHVQMGMYGLITVTSHNGTNYEMWPGGPEYDSDYNWLLTEIDSAWHYNIPVHDPLMDTINVPDYNPSHFLINGKGGALLNTDDSIAISGSINEKILLRIGGIGYNACKIVFPAGLNQQILMSDGRPLPNALFDDTLYLMPGERYEILLQANDTIQDSISVSYLDMNTGFNYKTWNVPIKIEGTFSIEERSLLNLKIYPNPVDDYLNIESNQSGRISIWDASGKLWYTSYLNDTYTLLNFSKMAAGSYIIELQNNNGVVREKFLKE